MFFLRGKFPGRFLVQYYSENEPPEELILPEPLEESLAIFLPCEGDKSESYGSEAERKTSRPCPANVEIGSSEPEKARSPAE